MRIIVSFSMLNVLVVDDDWDTVEVLCEFLTLKGMNVIGRCYNGHAAVQLYQQLKPDVVFCDVMMPEYDGFYALKNIRQYDPDAKVMMVTADMTEETREKLTWLQATAVIYKPYEIDDIVNKVSQLENETLIPFAEREGWLQSLTRSNKH